MPADPTPRADLLSVFALVNEFVRTHFPTHGSVELRIQIHGEPSPCVIPIPKLCPIPAPPPARQDDAALNEYERTVCQVIDELEDDETLTGERVAERAGYAFDTRMKDTLARLVRQGRIANRRPGYARVR